MKKKTNEGKSYVKGLAFIIESELDKTTAILAVEGITEKLKKMAADLADMEGKDILPVLDNMRLTFGAETTDRFHEVAVSKIRETMDAVMKTDEAITAEVSRLKAHVNGEEVNDMAMDAPVDDGAPIDDADADMGMGGEGDAAMTADDHLGGDDLGLGDDETADTGDLDAAFDAAATDSATAAGRARKESVETNVKALRESHNPDRLIFETFRRTLRESKGQAILAAKAVAEAFAIDVADVVEIVKEGKTWKDQKGRKKKNDDYRQARKDKKRERGDADSDSDLDEGTQFNRNAPKKTPPVFGKRKPADRPAGPVSHEGGKVVREFEMKPTSKAKKGMFDGKSEADLMKELAALKKSGPHKEGSPDFKKVKELEFALRAKSGWGKVEEVAKGKTPFDRKATQGSNLGEGEYPDLIKSREESLERSRKERASKGYSAMNAAKSKKPVKESVSDEHKDRLRKMGYHVSQMGTPERPQPRWFWLRDAAGGATHTDHIQDGVSPSEDEAWADLMKHAKERVKRAYEGAEALVMRGGRHKPLLNKKFKGPKRPAVSK